MKEYKIIHTTAEFIQEILGTEYSGHYGNQPEHYGRFFFEDYNEKGDKSWSACDNRSGDCFIEDFDSLGEALAWLIDNCKEEE